MSDSDKILKDHLRDACESLQKAADEADKKEARLGQADAQTANCPAHPFMMDYIKSSAKIDREICTGLSALLRMGIVQLDKRITWTSAPVLIVLGGTAVNAGLIMLSVLFQVFNIPIELSF